MWIDLPAPMNPKEIECLRAAFGVARSARTNGNHPFGAVLAEADDTILLRAENTVVTDLDCTGHAETNLMRAATKRFTAEQLSACTVYTSTEPCPMCAGAIFWGNVRRVVYGLGQESLYEMTGDSPHKLPLVLLVRIEKTNHALPVFPVVTRQPPVLESIIDDFGSPQAAPRFIITATNGTIVRTIKKTGPDGLSETRQVLPTLK